MGSAEAAAPSAFEQLKATSRGLRGTLAEELASDSPRFSSDAAQLLKFHGSYQQDDRDVRRERGQLGLDRDYVCMVRAGIPGGILSGEQYLAMDKLADTVGNATLRVTTRQGLQYHFVRKGDMKSLIGSLNEHLVTTLAACGDVVRNVMCCPAPPANAAEAQVQAAAAELSAALKPQSSAYWQLWVDGERAVSASEPTEAVDPLYGPTYLPRKFKIGIAFPGDNCVDIYTHDVGVVPTVRGGRVVAYTLVVGGGLGMTHNNPDTYPRLADPLGSVAPAELLDAVKAVIGIHRDFGDRGDRKHARLKYIVSEWGLEAFRAEVERRLGHELDASAKLDWSATSDHLGWRRQADGHWSLGVRIASGRIEDNGLPVRSAIRAVVERFAPGVRFTPRQDVLFTDIEPGDRDGVVALLTEYDIPSLEDLAPVERHAMACPALPTCGLALAEAERALPDMLTALRFQLATLGLGAEAVHVRMTGCPNGCSRPYSTEVGIVGRGKDHYTIYLGGDAQGTRLNTEYVDRVPVALVPQVLAPVLAAFEDERAPAERFGDYCARLGVAALRERFSPDDLLPRRRRPRGAARAGRPRGSGRVTVHACATISADDRAAVSDSVAVVMDGDRPAKDDRYRATDAGEGRFVRALAAEAARHLEGRPAQRVLAWAAGVIPRFAVTSSFGAESAVLLHMVSTVAPDVPVLFLDTGLHFSETIDYRRRLARDLGVTVVDVHPKLTPAEQAERFGDALFDRDPDACCGMRKTEPLRRALVDRDGWATGVRRVQTSERATTPVVEARRHADRWLVKVAPLADWSDADVAEYQRRHDLPLHPLVASGYRSIGCEPCTSPVAAGQDARAGRWSAFAKTECGLHLPGDDRLTSTPG